MDTAPAGIPEAAWLSWPSEARQFILAQQQENEQLRSKLSALATELAGLRERIGRSSRNSSKPPSSDGPGFKPPERRKGSGRKRGGQPGHPGAGPKLLPIERVNEVVEHHPEACQLAARQWLSGRACFQRSKQTVWLNSRPATIQPSCTRWRSSATAQC